jgi:hypothetical protein
MTRQSCQNANVVSRTSCRSVRPLPEGAGARRVFRAELPVQVPTATEEVAVTAVWIRSTTAVGWDSAIE